MSAGQRHFYAGGILVDVGTANCRIEAVRTPADLQAISGLFRAYASSLGIDLGYQGFEEELATLPGKYAPPTGELFLAKDGGGTPIGCVAVRPLPTDGVCELKRLYVDPGGRGLGLGQALLDSAISTARQLGYREIRLDTMGNMTQALSLYRKAGFLEIDPYGEAPLPDIVFMALVL